ncbi:MAG TPA: signal recognition particle protein [Alphaproteobacteria bacterium]|nr:signal recognition particle protein [Alphaproteobacteria bacterium]USO06419.1 MAG: signal recognition particle protein [Rhodospirillales bacterium]HOO82800.1 signal recognition particle protein [Alphaproteobacteria bacterium]
MFESLSEKLGGVFSKLRGKGALSENDVMAVSREIRVALLEADVALPVVKDFIASIKDKAVGQDIIKGVNPAQQVIKIVHDELVEMLGSETDALKFSSPPSVYLMVGLQGSGKTTSTAKISKLLSDKQNKKILMASLDVYRPAAQEQLKQLGEQTEIATLPVVEGQKPLAITKRAMDTARKEGYDVVMLDTAGRLSIDEALMDEVAAIQKEAKPIETLLVADAMTGQDAVQTAKAFDERVPLSGIMLTRVDGDARGGAAMSMKAVTGKPIKLIGVGEKWDEIETFHPERVAGRILGMGDVVSLVEKAVETVDSEEALKMAKKFKKGQFDFNDLLSQIQQMKKMGGMGAMMKLMPGLSSMAGKLDEAGLDDGFVKRQEAIIYSMTKAEREKPDLLNMRRKQRIATGSGTSVQDVNKIVKQLKQMQTMMKKMRKMGTGKMMGMMKDMMGGKADELELMAGSMDPDALGHDMAGLGQSGGLGPNPFTGGAGGLPGLGGTGLPGLGGGMPGLPSHGGKKKDRKKGKRK